MPGREPTESSESGRIGARGAAAGVGPRGERLQRVLNDAGVASRRQCEALIREGRVRVNGEVVSSLPAWADPHADTITIDGRVVPKPEPLLYLMMNKAARTLTTAREGADDSRRTVLDTVQHPLASRLFVAGRLEFDSTGLLILTNDGEMANRLTHARYGVEKTYQMVVRGTLDEESLARVMEVVEQAGRREAREAGVVRQAKVEVSILAREMGRTVLQLVAREGRVAAVRDALAAIGHPVKMVERVAIGPVRLRGVAPGQWRELEREELQALRRAVSGKGPASGGSGKRGGPPAPEAKIARRFRGIGKPIDAQRDGGRGEASNPAATGAPSSLDKRRGRGPGLNAQRKKKVVAKKPIGGRARDAARDEARDRVGEGDRPGRRSGDSEQARPDKRRNTGGKPGGPPARRSDRADGPQGRPGARAGKAGGGRPKKAGGGAGPRAAKPGGSRKPTQSRASGGPGGKRSGGQRPGGQRSGGQRGGGSKGRR
ncbi:MAG: pseudouridine synthase [Phycisphaerales bacterium]